MLALSELIHLREAGRILLFGAARPRRGIGNLLCLTNLRGTGGRRRNGQSSSQEATAAQEAAAAAAAAVTAVENDAASGVDGRRTSSGVSVNDGLPPAMRHVVPPNAWTSVDEEEARGD